MPWFALFCCEYLGVCRTDFKEASVAVLRETDEWSKAIAVLF